MSDITFPMPEGFMPPEGADQGTFEVLATLEMVDEGELRLLAIDGVSVGESEEPEKMDEDPEFAEATSPDTGDFQKAVSMGMAR
jgi:hypothetical protein